MKNLPLIFMTVVFSGFHFAQAQIVKISCIGNSITAGNGNFSSTYPGKLSKLMGAKYSVQNAGVSGCTLLKKGDYSYWTKGKLTDVFSFKPSIITIKLGTNDSKPQNWKYKAEFEADLRSLIDTLEKKIVPKPVIWLCLPVPAWANTYGISGQIVLNEEIPIIKKVAANLNLQVIDLHTALLNMQPNFKDGVHPDSIGLDSIAANIYRALTMSPTKILAKPRTNFSLPKTNHGLVQFHDLTGRFAGEENKNQELTDAFIPPSAGVFLIKRESTQQLYVKKTGFGQ